MTLSPQEVFLNEVAQDRKPAGEAVTWFESLSPPQQETELRQLAYICSQAQPRVEDVEPAIALAGLKPTYTACVLVRSAPQPAKAFHRVITLPEDERHKAFRLLLGLFCIADTRRRQTVCSTGCSHEWHNLGKT